MQTHSWGRLGGLRDLILTCWLHPLPAQCCRMRVGKRWLGCVQREAAWYLHSSLVCAPGTLQLWVCARLSQQGLWEENLATAGPRERGSPRLPGWCSAGRRQPHYRDWQNTELLPAPQLSQCSPHTALLPGSPFSHRKQRVNTGLSRGPPTLVLILVGEE